METKKIGNKKLWRVYVSSDQHKKLLDEKYDNGFSNLSQTLEYIIDNQRPKDQQKEYDSLSAKIQALARNNRTLANQMGQLLGDIQFLCQRMQEMRIAFEMSESELEERHEDTRKILEETVIIPENLKSRPMDYLVPTSKIEDEAEDQT